MPTTPTRPAPAVRTPVVLVADKLSPEGLSILEQAGLEVRVATGLPPDKLAEAARDVDGILVRSSSRITAEIIAAAPRLSAIGRAGIGVDNIDVPAASARGVVVMNTPLANATTTAELAIAHLFSLARHLPRAQATMREGKWEKTSLTGRELTGKTLLVVGLGKIGRIVAERGLGLRMHVLAHDPYLTGESPLPGVPLVDLDEGLARADFVTIHVPKSPDTTGMFGAATLARMKPGSYLVNCARGGLVVERDLLAALDSGHLAGAALDVFETEPLPSDSPLRRHEKLVLTPHLGASSDEAQERVSVEIARQMADYLLHGEARCAVNAPAVPAEQLAVLRPYLQLARRAGLMLAQLDDRPIVRVEIAYTGELAEHDTRAVRLEVLAGLLAPHLDGPVNAVNAEALAAERGLKVLEEHRREPSEYTALLEVTASGKDGQPHTVAGTASRGQPRLVSFEGFGVDFVPGGTLLMTCHRDVPGVLGRVATWLGLHEVNIGGLHMAPPSREGGTALALYELSRPLQPSELEQLARLPELVAARILAL